MGTPLKGCIMYLNWWPLPCPDCARGIIQSGITTVIGPDRPFPVNASKGAKDWKKSFETTTYMFNEAGINMRIITMPRIL